VVISYARTVMIMSRTPTVRRSYLLGLYAGCGKGAKHSFI